MKKHFVFFFIVFYFSFIICLHSEQQYQLKTPDYFVSKIPSGTHKISMQGYYSYAVPGYPELPSKIYRIAIPADADLNSIDIDYQELERTSLGGFDIPELLPMVTWVNGERIVGSKADIYSNNKYYPESTVEYLGVSQMRKWRIVNIKYTPFQYNPVTKDLVFVPEVKLSIKYRQAEIGRAILDLELTDTVMDKRAEEILTNYDEAKVWYAPRTRALKQAQIYNYVIITTNDIQTNSTELTNFISYLTNEGYSVKVVTETDFGTLVGQAPNQKAEKIREWLKNNYVSMGIEYVLLIGNPSPYESGEGDIPMKLCWPYVDWNLLVLYESPTDYFYADLTGNWDLDGDGYFGSYDFDQGIGGVDFANEVYVGRIPVYSGVSELDSVLSKIIGYSNPPNLGWRRNVLLPMSFYDVNTDGAYLGEAMKSDYLPDSDYSPLTLYMQGSLCLAADSVFDSTDELISQNVYTWWRATNCGMVWWLGHGNQTQAAFGFEDCGWGIIMDTAMTVGLKDDYPSFVYQGSCLNGFPEDSNNLGTALLYNGAITTVSASRVSWYLSGSWDVDKKYCCDNASLGYFYGQELITNMKQAANALYDVKSDMGINGGLLGGQSWMNLFDFNLYGSPESWLLVSYDLTISSSQGGTTEPPPGVYTYLAGTQDSITAISDTNYRFDKWTGDVPQGSENNFSFAITMDTDKSVQANFIRQYTLSIAASTGGTTNPSPGSYIHDSEAEVSITAIANNGYKFTGWTGSVISSGNPITVTMDSDKSMTANFRSIPEEKGKGLCFLATAAYGTSLHPRLDILREFRDKYLMSNKLCRELVSLYYKYSPPIANIIAEHKILKIFVRIYILPLVALGYSMIHLGPTFTAIMLVFILVLPIFLILCYRRKSIKNKIIL